MPRFTFYDYFLTFISTCTYIADVATDIALIVYFFTEGHQVWGSLSLCFVVLAALLMQVFSFHWHVSDKTLSVGSLLIHLLFLAPLHRYVKVFHLGRKSRKSGSSEDLGAAYRAINDISILRLVETFLESAPQLVLQLYIVLSNLQNFNTLLGFSMVFSLLSVSWSITAYTDALHLAYKKFYKRSFVSMVTHLIWQTGMVTARVVSIVLFATVFHGYVGIPIGVHFVIMLVWIIRLEPDFGSTPCERRLFTIVAAAIHIFCFLNLKDGNSRYRMAFYYALSLIETALYMSVWYLCKTHGGPIWFDVSAFSVVFGAFGLGTIFMLLYYGCCHPSGPAPIPSQKPDFLKPGNMTFGAAAPPQYKPNMLSQKPQKNNQMKNTTSSKGNKPSIFDVSTTSARINLWLSASLDLSKEGLVENPDNHLDPSLQETGKQNISRGGDGSIQGSFCSLRSPVDVHLSPLGSSGYSSAAKPLLGNYKDPGYRDRSGSDPNRTADRVDLSSISRATDREQSFPDYNLVEMFARCKLDPSFVSNSSISDILFNQTLKQNTPTSRNGMFSLSPENPSGRTLLEQNKSEMNISGSNWNQSRTSNDSSKSLICSPNRSSDRQVLGELGPPSISPLDPSRLWEESEGRLGHSYLNNPGSDPSLHYKSGERNPVLTVTPDASRGITHFSMSYSTDSSDNPSPGQNESRNRDRSGLSETENSLYKNGVDKSIELLSGSSHLVNQSVMLSFSDVSLQLPDSSTNSRNRSDTQPNTNKSSAPSIKNDGRKKKRPEGIYDSCKGYSFDDYSKSRSIDSFSSRECSPTDRQSSYLSDRGLPSSDRGLSSSHSTNNHSGHRSMTSSGFQSEESNISSTSPAYSHLCHTNVSTFQFTPLVENEISTICPPSSIKPVTGKRVSYDDDIYADVSKFKNSTPIIGESNVCGDIVKENVTPITSAEPKKPQVFMPPSALFYENSQIDSPVLPPLGWSRCSSSTGSSSSGRRFFKDPSLDSNEDLNNKSDKESKFTNSMMSHGTNSGFLEKSSLSAFLSDLSSSKCTRTSEETLSMASDPDMLRRSTHHDSSDSMMRNAESLPYMPEKNTNGTNSSDTGIAASLSYQLYKMHGRRSLDKSLNSIQEYENINNYSRQSSNTSSSSSLSISGSKTVSSYLYNSEPEKNRLQELYNEFSHASIIRNESDINKTFEKDQVPNYENVDDLNDLNNVDCVPESDSGNGRFNRNNWRASLDKEMKERLVHDIEKLAPRKLYELSTKNGPPRKKLSPVNITEYTDSPYKFRKQGNTGTPSEYENIDSLGDAQLCEYTESPFKVRKSDNTARRAIYGSMKSASKDSLTGEYENINSLSGKTDYVNIDHLLGSCPVATPESLSDTVILDDIHGTLGRGDKTFNQIENCPGELLQDVFENESLRSQELSRTKSPINISGLNSAFRPVKARNSVESPLSRTSSGSDKTYNIENEIDYKTDQFVNSNQDGSVESTDASIISGKSSRRQSNISNCVSDVENTSSFQWTRDTGILSMTGWSDSVSQSPRNYLQLAGKAPLNFSVPTFLHETNNSQTSKHSYSDSIPWEDSDASLQNTADMSDGKFGFRQPLKPLENTPVFSPIYGHDARLNIDLLSRKRFMSTPKLSTGSELSLSRNSDESKTPQRTRSSGLSRKTHSDNTSTWSTQSETDLSCDDSAHGTFALSKTTYI